MSSAAPTPTTPAVVLSRALRDEHQWVGGVKGCGDIRGSCLGENARSHTQRRGLEECSGATGEVPGQRPKCSSLALEQGSHQHLGDRTFISAGHSAMLWEVS